MISHPPFPYQRTSSDFKRESRGVFRVLHDKGLALECTYNRPELRAMSSQSERPLRWLWQDKIPLGKLTLIEGPPAVGKLFVALDIAARVSSGALGAGGRPDFGNSSAAVSAGTAAGETPAPGSTSDPGVISGMDHLGQDVATPSTSGWPGLERVSEAPDGEESWRRPNQSEPIEAPAQTDEGADRLDVDRAGSPPGLPCGPAPATPGQSVVLVCDSWQAEDMIAARTRMLGANQERIVTFTEVDCTDQCGGHRHRRPIRFPVDLPMFEYILRQHRGCRLIVIDNLENYCESPRQLRQAIQELDEIAIYFGVAIVATLQRNVRFAPDGTIRDTARPIDGPARCIWCLTPDAAHPGLLRLEPKRMAFCKKPEGIACRIGDAGQVVWEPLPPYEKPPTEAARRKKLEQARMQTWLETTLGTGVVPAETIYDAGQEQGFSKDKLITARDELGARTFKIGYGRAGAWMWTKKPQSEVTDAEVQFAYIGLPKDFSFEPEDEPGDEPETPIPGEEGAGQEDHGRSAAHAAQKSENFGVLNKNGRKRAGSRSSRTARKRPLRFPGLNSPGLNSPSLNLQGLNLQDLTTAQLREIGLQMLGLSHSPRQNSPEEPAHHECNGHSSNGHSES